MNLDPRELALRQETYAWIRSKYVQDAAAFEKHSAGTRARREQAQAALDLVERMRLSGDVAGFRQSLNALTALRSSALALSGPSGQMVVNQIANNSPDKRQAAELLGRALAVPASDDEASARINEVAAYCAEIKVGSGPQPARVPTLLSGFWILADPERWPAKWGSAVTAFERLGWVLPSDHAEGYLEFAQLVRALGAPEDVLATLLWYSEVPWLGPDPVIEKRTDWAWQLKEEERDSEPVAFQNVDAMFGPLRQAGDDLSKQVGAALDRELTKRLSPRTRIKDVARYDAYVVWNPPQVDSGWSTSPNFRVWFGRLGVSIGLHPGYREKGWINYARPLVEKILPAGMELLDYYQPSVSSLEKPGQNDFLVGRFFRYDEFDWDNAEATILHVAASVLPIMQTLLSDGPTWSGSPEKPSAVDSSADLLALFQEFLSDTGYPTERDVKQRAAREPLAALIAKDQLHAIDVAQFRNLMTSNKYGNAGNRAVLNSKLADPDDEAVQALVVEVVGDLLYGDGSFEERLDRAPERLKGLGQAGAMKLLAVTYPERFLPIFPLTGPRGKLAILPKLGLPVVADGSVGERSVRANDLLREQLGSLPNMADDPWGQMQFAYWLLDRELTAVSGDEESGLEERLATATDRCTLPPESPFLGELVSLLEDKGQIVLYGPPGTGKTFVALELAEALAPDEECRALVQFHPSTAYEDFMEGFRPVLQDGNLTYVLTQGPIIELAEHALIDNRPHVLVIDEMNRANLPKVFGELLFLLEYRERPARLAYRAAEDPFALPKNLWIIGTMNLADRSVGQIDAALRRRFAFVSFAPNDEHNGGLLRRWLAKENLPTWPADVVDEVNDELEKDLGHADLLIGPSYFMKPDLDETRMAGIWRYAIEPLMSDLFHGDEQLVKKFGWASVTKRHASLLPGGSAAGLSLVDEETTADDAG